jgi:hypothetical protein
MPDTEIRRQFYRNFVSFGTPKAIKIKRHFWTSQPVVPANHAWKPFW